MATRKRNPRRLLLAALKGPRERLNWLHSHWTFRGSRINHAVTPRRARTADEYPENDPQAWQTVIDHLEEAISELVKIRDFAEGQYRIANRNPGD